MLKWMPKEIIEGPFSQVRASVHNGYFLEPNPKAEADILKALAEAGFRCSKDQRLVLKASGRGPLAHESEVPSLIMALMSSNPDVRLESIEKLAAIGPAAVPALIESLSSGNALIRQGVAAALGEITPSRTTLYRHSSVRYTTAMRKCLKIDARLSLASLERHVPHLFSSDDPTKLPYNLVEHASLERGYVGE